jgi:hypothetical protein
MGYLNNPAKGFIIRAPHFLHPFLPPAFDMRDKPPEYHRFQRRLPRVPFVKTQMLGMFNYLGALSQRPPAKPVA